MELHQLVVNDAKFDCHKDSTHICRGFALYMNGIVKRSKFHDTLWMQENAELAEGEESLASFDGSKINEWHVLDKSEIEELVMKSIG